MNVYTAKFEGYWPVGAVALVVAEDANQALELLNKELLELGLKPTEIEAVRLQNIWTPRVDILLDGNY